MSVTDAGPIAASTIAVARSATHLSSAAQAVTANVKTPNSLFLYLLETKQFTDAIHLYPAIVPIRKAIWWACLCTWYSASDHLSAAEAAALKAAVHWVQQPTREHRLSAQTSETSWATAAGCCAAAVVRGCHQTESGEWKGENLAASARLCANAVFAALANSNDTDLSQTRTVLALAVEVEQNRLLAWDAVTEK